MERTPAMPGLFVTTEKTKYSSPNPRTVRASDLTWFNSRGTNIIRSTYDTCTSNLDRKNYKWGALSRSKHRNVSLHPSGGKGQCNLFHSFTTERQPCDNSRFANCRGKYIHKGFYVNPN
tara:strand:+ start:78 stop:434 length:357 start_codon:yes stop_codon:yes gene_type:complete